MGHAQGTRGAGEAANIAIDDASIPARGMAGDSRRCGIMKKESNISNRLMRNEHGAPRFFIFGVDSRRVLVFIPSLSRGTECFAALAGVALNEQGRGSQPGNRVRASLP